MVYIMMYISVGILLFACILEAYLEAKEDK